MIGIHVRAVCPEQREIEARTKDQFRTHMMRACSAGGTAGVSAVGGGMALWRVAYGVNS